MSCLILTGTYPLSLQQYCSRTGSDWCELARPKLVCSRDNKAYTTRVGGGRSQPRILGDGDRMSERGREFGTVTGRKRRCGWFDAVMVNRHDRSQVSAAWLLTGDVLDGFDVLKICVGYQCGGSDKTLDYYRHGRSSSM